LAIGGLSVKNHYSSVGFSSCEFYNFGYFPKINLNTNKHNSNCSQKINFLFVGQLIPRKGIDVLINLIHYLNKSYKNEFSFTIIGDGVLKNELLEKTKDIKNLNYLGLINDSNVIENFYIEADIFFLSSYFDGWGAVVNEALSKSCSLLLSEKVYASKSLLIAGKNGFTFNPYNFDSLKDKVDNYFKNKDILKKHSNFSLKLYNEWNEKNAAISFQNLINDKKNTNLTLLRKL
jgi:glycosyltransferase involved in cell wall biosynthesis